jgi:hypothetical protein
LNFFDESRISKVEVKFNDFRRNNNR